MKREDITAKTLPFLRSPVAMILDYVDSKQPLSGKNVNVSDSPTGRGKVIDARGGSSAGSSVPSRPWQPFPSPWLGTGTDPYLANRVMRFRLVKGKFVNATPVNTSDEFLAYGDATDVGIEEGDAVITQIYLHVPVSESTIGSGEIQYDRGTISIVEGSDLVTALGGSSAIPGFDSTDGSVPAYLIVSLGEASWWGGSLHLTQGYFSNLSCAAVLTGATPDGANFGRGFIISGAES